MTDAQWVELAVKMSSLRQRLQRAEVNHLASDLHRLADDLAQLAGDVDEARDAVYGILNPEDT